MVSVGIWCNGNTTHFDCVVLGSSPSIPAKKFYLRKVLSGCMVRLGRSGQGSNPCTETSLYHLSSDGRAYGYEP
jgi:hypothetical protein